VTDPTAGPTLNDLLNAEASRLITALTGDEFDPVAPPSNEGIIARLDRYAAVTADLARAFALGARCFWRHAPPHLGFADRARGRCR